MTTRRLAATPSMPHEPVRSPHRLERLGFLLKHRRLVLTTFGVTVGLMMMQAYAALPMYRAKSQVLIQAERPAAVSSLSASDPHVRDSEQYYNTQYRILQSRELARRVVKRLDLQNVPEFNGTMASAGGPLSLVRHVHETAVGGVRTVFAAITNRGKPPAAEPPAPDESAQEAALVSAFLSRLRIEPQHGTRRVDVFFDAADPTFAAKAADTHAEEYVQRNLELKDRAETPGAPYTPDLRRAWMLALLLGLGLALGLAFAVEYLDDTVKTPDDVTRRLKLPLLGLIPAARGNEAPLLISSAPHDFGDAFRSLRNSLGVTGGETTRIIGVTSSQPLEGRTTTACNLGAALALDGARVLLIDGDMRRPRLHKTMRLQNAIGLSHLLVGQARVRDAVQRTSEPNLFVISAGRTPPNPVELLSSDRMKAFVQNLRSGPFDWVILDTPPILAAADAVIVGPLVTGLVFVIGSGVTRRVHAERAIKTLRTHRPNLIGAILNRADCGERTSLERIRGRDGDDATGR